MSLTASTVNASIPAAIDAEAYVWPVIEGDECEAQGVILARIDSKLAGGRYIYRYAPVSTHFSGVDSTRAFWDTWKEVVVHAC